MLLCRVSLAIGANRFSGTLPAAIGSLHQSLESLYVKVVMVVVLILHVYDESTVGNPCGDYGCDCGGYA